PMVIMPYAHDQADNAWRASRLGVARVLPRHRYQEPALVSALAALLGSPEQVVTCRAVAAEMAREHGAAAAAATVLRALGHDVRTGKLAQSATM
ncbi:MAG: hypothetical protein KC442_20960, partial [Thermomicrobiales bacterium]|nr:hypothetical protein [Thermomicrobiales bacterium]